MYVNVFKHLLWNHWADWSEISYGVSLGRGNERLFKRSWSHDQDGRHAHIWLKSLKNLLLRNQKADDLETWYCSIGCSSTTNFVQMMTQGWPWPILRQGQIWPLKLIGKGKTMDFSETTAVYDLKLATDDRSDMKFLLTSKLCPLGAVCPPAPELYICIKSWTKCIKSDATNG